MFNIIRNETGTETQFGDKTDKLLWEFTATMLIDIFMYWENFKTEATFEWRFQKNQVIIGGLGRLEAIIDPLGMLSKRRMNRAGCVLKCKLEACRSLSFRKRVRERWNSFEKTTLRAVTRQSSMSIVLIWFMHNDPGRETNKDNKEREIYNNF